MSLISENNKPTVVLSLNDWPFFPTGKSNAGGEMATLHLAKAFVLEGYKTFCLGNLPEGDSVHHGIQFVNIGEEYNVKRGIERVRAERNPFIMLSATLSYSLFECSNDPLCCARILIVHSPFTNLSGLLPKTTSLSTDAMVCVSYSQANQLVNAGCVPAQIKVVRNGFDPEIYSYGDPDKRDYKKIVYAGQLSYEKGTEVMFNTFIHLAQQKPDCTFDIYGRTAGVEVFDKNIELVQKSLPNLRYHGPVSQATLAEAYRTAGLCAFTSITYESCPLTIIDAQASGCPVVAFKVGGVPELIHHQQTGIVLDQINLDLYLNETTALLDAPEKLKEFSINCERLSRQNTWQKVAQQITEIAAQIQKAKNTK